MINYKYILLDKTGEVIPCRVTQDEFAQIRHIIEEYGQKYPSIENVFWTGPATDRGYAIYGASVPTNVLEMIESGTAMLEDARKPQIYPAKISERRGRRGRIRYILGSSALATLLLMYSIGHRQSLGNYLRSFGEHLSNVPIMRIYTSEMVPIPDNHYLNVSYDELKRRMGIVPIIEDYLFDERASRHLIANGALKVPNVNRHFK